MSDPAWLPNFLIAGAPKAGTSSMYSWIADHPDAFGSTDKETYFFVDPGTHMFRPDFNVANGIETYRAQFPLPHAARPRVILEATPSYLYSAAALAHVPGLPSRPRCLFMLREPGEQVYSLYNYFRTNWDWIPPQMSFAAYLDAVRAGSHEFKGNEIARNALDFARYADFLEPWRDRLGAERIMVVTFDALRADQRALTARIAAWLGLDPAFYDSYAFGRENETYAPRNQALQNANVAVRGLLPRGRIYKALRGVYRRLNTRRPEGPDDAERALIGELSACYAPDNARLARLFDLDLPGWPTA